MLIFIADAYLMLNWGEQNNNIMVRGLSYCILFLTVCFGEYIFSLIAIQDLKIKHILRNALLLMTLSWKMTLGILIINIIYISFIVFAFPLSILICGLWLISFKQYTVCWLLNKVFDTYIFKAKPNNNEQKAC